jgi:hypothetical protein
MMLFKDYYFLSEDRKDMYSWLSPNGKIHHVKGSGHGDDARIILKSLGIYDVSDYLTKLFELGYFRITYYGDSLYMHNTKVFPSKKQLNVMKNVAIENNMDNIKLDNEDIDRVLWSNQDL